MPKENIMLTKYRYFQWVFTLLFLIVSNSFAGGWEQVSALPTQRIAAAAAAINDEIYLIGGYDLREHLGGGAPALSTVDVYDTQTNTWHNAADMPTPRIGACASVFSNDIYVFGGYSRNKPGDLNDKKSVEMYDPRSDIWVKKRDMPTLRRRFTTAVANGKIYVIGGTVLDKRLGKQVITGLVEAYDPLTDRWEKRADMLIARQHPAAEVVDGKVYVIGGYILQLGALANRFTSSIEEYNPKANTWRKLPDMPMRKGWFASAVVDNEIYTIGGVSLDHGINRIDAVDVYNPTANNWRVEQPITIAKTTTPAVANGTIYLFGGLRENAEFSPIVEAFDTGFLAVTAKDKLHTSWGEIKKSD